MGVLATLVSTLHKATLPAADVMRDGCADRLCDMLHSGWPFPFVRDLAGLSPTNSANLSGVLMGDDRLYWAPFLLNVLLYSSLAFLALWALARMRRR